MKYWDQAVTDGTIAGVTFRMYLAGYKGVLLGESTIVPSADIQAIIPTLNALGGSPIGNSRVKLTNVDDCIKKGFVKEGQTPLEVAAQQLLKDGVHVLHTIGGDDTNTQAAQLSKYLLEKHGGLVHVIGMPKTIDNDVYPIAQVSSVIRYTYHHCSLVDSRSFPLYSCTHLFIIYRHWEPTLPPTKALASLVMSSRNALPTRAC